MGNDERRIEGSRTQESPVKLEGQSDVINSSLQEAENRGPRRRGMRGDGERRVTDRGIENH